MVDISDEVSQKMAEERFKVEDKVVPIDPMSRIQGTNIGTVIKLSPPGVNVEWRVNGRIIDSFYLPDEIRHVYQKGQQLVFPFMNEN